MKLSNYVTIAATIFMLYSCKKTETDTPTNTPASSLLCDGNKTTNYFPDRLQNKWVYDIKYNGKFEGKKAVINFTDSVFMMGKPYLTLFDSTGYNLTGKLYLTRDSANNMVGYNAYFKKHYIEVPSSPKVNESWDYYNVATRKVVNVNASFNTPNCNYSGLLQIDELQNGGGLIATMYYKKGLGMVYQKRYGMASGKRDTSEYFLSNLNIRK